MRRGVLLLLLLALAVGAQADGRRSGLLDMTPATQALQRDDGLNPAQLWLAGGEAAWAAAVGQQGRRCADCHGEVDTTMRGVAARYPAFDAESGTALTLAGRINACRVRHQRAAPLAAESDTLLSLEARVARASRGLPIAPPDDARLQRARERGRALFAQRIGQLDLSCADCHDTLAGRRLGGSVIPQGHPTAYPIYRLEWQSLGSLQRRLRTCFAGARAEAPAWGDADLVALELHLMQRAAGMPLESPGVRP
jgi:sulfur-oxidizing protein SoxA